MSPAEPVRLLLIGEEHIRAKIARHYDQLEDAAGLETHYFVDDRSGITRETQAGRARPLRVTFAPVPTEGRLGVLRYFAAFARCLLRVRPQVLEVYTSIRFAVLYPMILFARAMGVRVVVVCRGELYPPVFWDETSPSGRWFLVRMLRAADLVVCKEAYMPPILETLAPGVPYFMWPNSVPVKAEPRYEREQDVVLFLNFFKRWRNLEVAIRAAARVRERIPGVRFLLVGGTQALAEKSRFFSELLEYEEELRALIAELRLEDCVEIQPFTTEVEPYFARAKVYLLPADLVFCNFGLLEAMERGVPAVVTDEKDPHARLIVDDGVNGRTVPIDPAAVAEAVAGLLADEPLRQRMARAAHAKIRSHYNLERWIGALGEQYHALAREGRARPAQPAAGASAAAPHGA